MTDNEIRAAMIKAASLAASHRAGLIPTRHEFLVLREIINRQPVTSKSLSKLIGCTLVQIHKATKGLREKGFLLHDKQNDENGRYVAHFSVNPSCAVPSIASQTFDNNASP